jgi:ATP-dependent DNA helicase RecG
MTRHVMAERLGLSPEGVRYHLRRLQAAGRLRRVGPDKGGHWEVLTPEDDHAKGR